MWEQLCLVTHDWLNAVDLASFLHTLNKYHPKQKQSKQMIWFMIKPIILSNSISIFSFQEAHVLVGRFQAEVPAFTKAEQTYRKLKAELLHVAQLDLLYTNHQSQPASSETDWGT